MTPDEQQQAYRASCTHRRKGAVITDLATGQATTHTSVNAAKHAVRTGGIRSYTER
jgi:hypothetical protein